MKSRTLILIYGLAPQLLNLHPCLSGRKYGNFNAPYEMFNHRFPTWHFSLRVVRTCYSNSNHTLGVYNGLISDHAGTGLS
jgi:hypothetical protein